MNCCIEKDSTVCPTLPFEEKRQVLVKTLKGNTIAIAIDKLDTLDDVKAKICDKTGDSAKHFRLALSGKQLEDGRPILDQMDDIIVQSGDHIRTGSKAHPTLIMNSYLIGGANRIFHPPRPNTQESTSPDGSEVAKAGKPRSRISRLVANILNAAGFRCGCTCRNARAAK